MTLKDISNGPDWVFYLVAAVFAGIAVLLLSGKGAWLIAGYNTSSPEEKQKYDEKRLCRVMGSGAAVIAVFLLGVALFQDRLPASFASVLGVVIGGTALVMVVLANTICRRKP